MPFCPECKYEYVPGIVDCPDCYVKLVDKLEDEKPEQQEPVEDIELVSVGVYPDYLEGEMAKLKLESEGIECALANEIVSRTGQVPTFALPFANPYAVEVKVREEDAERARAILEAIEG